METIELEELAADLDRLIDAFGFGGEFSKQDLYDYFKSQDVMESKISQLIENELIEQNQKSQKRKNLKKHLPIRKS